MSAVGKGRSRELCEALELAAMTLQADHLRFFTSNHSRPITATIITTHTGHDIDEDDSSLVVAGFDSGAFGAGKGFTVGSEGRGRESDCGVLLGWID